MQQWDVMKAQYLLTNICVMSVSSESMTQTISKTEYSFINRNI